MATLGLNAPLNFNWGYNPNVASAEELAMPAAVNPAGYVPANYNLNAPVGSGPSIGMDGFRGLDFGNQSIATPNLMNGGGLNMPGSAYQPNAFTKQLQDWGVIGTKNKDGTGSDGWGGLALGAAQGLGSLYMGMQQYNLAKETLANNKAQFERNFAANKATTNANLEDRQRARVASNAGAYTSVGDYMAKNGIK